MYVRYATGFTTQKPETLITASNQARRSTTYPTTGHAPSAASAKTSSNQ